MAGRPVFFCICQYAGRGACFAPSGPDGPGRSGTGRYKRRKVLDPGPVCLLSGKRGKEKLRVGSRRKKLLFWLVHAGIRLSTAELVYLREHKIEADPGLLHPGNRQALVETIYTAGTIADNLLENRMAEAGCRDSVVRDILSLLEKKKLLIL